MAVEEEGTVIADVETQELTVRGSMNGNTDASECISIANTATYVGDLRAPRVVLEDGARFRGNIEMDVPLPEGL
jgi:cytoskeletal protein CcmA (bactofilin family)